MIIEQEQILTTQNLAPLFAALSLQETLNNDLLTMAKNCFRWICRRQQAKASKWHARLIMVKNTAYAWRQMIFYLSMVPAHEANTFIPFATDLLGKQSPEFKQRFGPAVRGLELAFTQVLPADRTDSRLFLGWSKDKHWLLA
jgi:hypothetical protein